MRDFLNELTPLDCPPRLGRLTGYFDRRAEPAMKLAFAEAVNALAARGAEVVTLEDPIDFDQVLIQHRTVMAAEAARVHSDWLAEAPDEYPPRIRDLIREGHSFSAQEYLRARDGMDQTELSLCSFMEQEKLCALITPATVGVATDPSTTGDPAFNSPWSYTDLPTVSFPTGVSREGMPIAVQLVGYQLYDIELLRISQWCEQAIRTRRQ